MTTFTYEHRVHKALQAGRMLRGWTQAQMAELMETATNDDGWNTDRVTATENGRRKVGPEELRIFAEVQGFDVEFYWYGPPLNRRAADLVTPGYLNPEPINRSRIDHAVGDCIGCAIDRNFHVVDEWNYHDPITGQIELILDLTGEYAKAV
jgi:transcriptional regulator with XRE-family HTH domain